MGHDLSCFIFIWRDRHDIENIFRIDQFDGKTQFHEPFTGFFSDTSPGLLIFDTENHDESETLLPVVCVADEVEV